MLNDTIGRKIFKENIRNVYIVYTSISLWSKFEASVQSNICWLPAPKIPMKKPIEK